MKIGVNSITKITFLRLSFTNGTIYIIERRLSNGATFNSIEYFFMLNIFYQFKLIHILKGIKIQNFKREYKHESVEYLSAPTKSFTKTFGRGEVALVNYFNAANQSLKVFR